MLKTLCSYFKTWIFWIISMNSFYVFRLNFDSIKLWGVLMYELVRSCFICNSIKNSLPNIHFILDIRDMLTPKWSWLFIKGYILYCSHERMFIYVDFKLLFWSIGALCVFQYVNISLENTRFTTVPLKSLSNQLCRRNASAQDTFVENPQLKNQFSKL